MFKVTKVLADVVLGKTKPVDKATKVSIQRKTSIRFMQSEDSRQNSGNPGYIKDLPVLTGELIFPKVDVITQKQDKPYIKQSKTGFSFLGADETGKCILNDPKTQAPNKYYDEPVLTFGDAILTGCFLDLTLKELEDFCKVEKF